MEKLIIDSTLKALMSVKHKRFYKTERGFQAEFHSELRNVMKEKGIVNSDIILESEHQKGSHHCLPTIRTRPQRPDIILHIPTYEGGDVTKGNYAVYALKKCGNEIAAKDDFKKLDQMFTHLNYSLGFFININSDIHFLEVYTGKYKERIHSLTVRLENEQVSINHAYFSGTDLILDVIHPMFVF